jgi:hypothetical protein
MGLCNRRKGVSLVVIREADGFDSATQLPDRHRRGRATGSATAGTRSACNNRRPGPNTLSEEAEAFLRNYPECQWIGRERKRLANSIDRVDRVEP